MRLIAIILALSATLTAPAAATPPRSVQIDETLLAENSTHLFVLRRINDNLGYHHTTQTDVQLIARDLMTGRDTRFWPVQSILDYGPDFDSYGVPARIERRDGGNEINPFDVLRQQDARWILPATHDPWIGSAQLSGPDIEVVDSQGRVTHSLALSEARDRLTRSVADGRAVESPRESIGGKPGPDPEIIAPQTCRTAELHAFLPGVERAPGLAVRLTCIGEEVWDVVSVLVIVPALE